ncbi:MAG: hypothetical protein Q7K35_00255 [bacterium]|nr:hypothetical protein [bacterium]
MNYEKVIKKLRTEKGTSLLELLVAITLFTFMILVATQIFKMVIDGQRNAISAQNVQENMRYALEKMSKEIRMAQKSDTDCLPGATNKVFNVTTDGINDTIYFKNKDGACVSYYLLDSRLGVTAGGVPDFATPAKIKVSNLRFNAVDDGIGDVQPYVTMSMDVEAIGLAIHKQKMKLQITVSSRYYE